MEILVESCDSTSLPVGAYVGVRVGDVLKQGRYEPQRAYHFPQVNTRRSAKIDIYQHVGSCFVPVDPDTKSVHEVAVQSSNPDIAEMKLKVSVHPRSSEAGKEPREVRTKALKAQAKDYLSKHSIEERLGEAVKSLLKELPANPMDFLCKMLLEGPVSPHSDKTGASPTAATLPEDAQISPGSIKSPSAAVGRAAPVTSPPQPCSPAAAVPESPTPKITESAAPQPANNLPTSPAPKPPAPAEPAPATAALSQPVATSTPNPPPAIESAPPPVSAPNLAADPGPGGRESYSPSPITTVPFAPKDEVAPVLMYSPAGACLGTRPMALNAANFYGGAGLPAGMNHMIFF